MAFNYSPKIVTDGLVLYLDAANTRSYPGSGTTWNDISRGGNNGTLVNGPTFSNVNGGSIVFDGTNQYATAQSSNSWAFGQNGTVEQWVYVNGSDGNNRFWCVNNNSTSLDAYLNSSGYTLGFHGALALTTTEIPFRRWTLLTVTYTSGQMRVYFNTAEQPLTGTTTGYNITNNGILYIARYRTDPYELNGSIGSMKIYNRALSTTEILQNYNATKTRFGLT